jgi:hypothetical protein
MKTTTLFRPVNQAELDLITKANWKSFPPRLPQQPIFYPVMNINYARQIAVEWNVPAYGIGYVLKFEVGTDFLSKYPIQNVGGKIHDELWIPVEDLDEFNNHIIGLIEVVEKHQ